jgi:hypothetical protein
LRELGASSAGRNPSPTESCQEGMFNLASLGRMRVRHRWRKRYLWRTAYGMEINLEDASIPFRADRRLVKLKLNNLPPKPGMTRRQALKTAAIMGIRGFAAPMISKGRYLLFAGSAKEYSARAIELVGRSTVIDILGPFAISPARSSQWLLHPESFTPADLEQFRSSGIRVFHIAIGNGGPDAYQESIKFFGLWNEFIAHHDQSLMRIDSLASTSKD